MTITAKFTSRCAACHQAIQPGTRIEWIKGQPARHTSCAPQTSRRTSPRTARPSYASGYAANGTWRQGDDD